MRELRHHEEIIGTWRRHGASLTGVITLVSLLVLIPIIFSVPLLRSGGVGRGFFFILLLIPIVMALHYFVQWFYTTSTVTSERIILVHQHGFFHRDVQEVERLVAGERL